MFLMFVVPLDKHQGGRILETTLNIMLSGTTLALTTACVLLHIIELIPS